MNNETGKLHPVEEVAEMNEEEQVKMVPVVPSYAQLTRGRIGRNERCPCGSGKKFKKCCLVL